jgi:hypothetical protein
LKASTILVISEIKVIVGLATLFLSLKSLKVD